MKGKFWFVWNEKKRVPGFKHPTLKSAQLEAKRLSEIERGNIFYILESVGLRFRPIKD